LTASTIGEFSFFIKLIFDVFNFGADVDAEILETPDDRGEEKFPFLIFGALKLYY
tara:strand:+ start:4577 stop:4741 length:165 start_codon:yes stop_codon:yes gene_type:complete